MTNFDLWKKLCLDSRPQSGDYRYREYYDYKCGELTLIRSDRFVTKWIRDVFWAHIKGENWLISFRLDRVIDVEGALHIRGDIDAAEETLILFYMKFS